MERICVYVFINLPWWHNSLSTSWAVCCACCAFDKSNFKPCPLVLVGFLMRWFTPPPSIFSIRRPSGHGQNCGDWFCWSSQGTVCSSDNIYLHKRWYAPGVHSKLNPSLKSARCFSGNYINRGWCCSSGYTRHNQLMISYFHSREPSAWHGVMNI